MRKKMIEADVVEAVLGLGPNLFYNSPMEACIVFCRAKKAPDRKGKVLFVNAVDDIVRQSAQSFLTEANIKRIDGCYRNFSPEAGFSEVVTTEQISTQNFSLSIPLYVKTTSTQDKLKLTDAVSAYETSSAMFHSAVSQMLLALKDGVQ
jgi:type I restriction enzyme M protein